MKARVKETGEIIDVIPFNRDGFAYIQDDGETVYEFHELEILDEPDYWTRLEYQYAGMAMQGMVRTVGHDRMYPPEKIAIYATACAHALIQKLKEKEERK